MIRIEIEGIEDLVKFVALFKHNSIHAVEKLATKLDKAANELNEVINENQENQNG